MSQVLENPEYRKPELHVFDVKNFQLRKNSGKTATQVQTNLEYESLDNLKTKNYIVCVFL